MEITRENVQARLEQLDKQLAQMNQQKRALESDIDAVYGAIQDCQHWLTVLAGEPSQAEA